MRKARWVPESVFNELADNNTDVTALLCSHQVRHDVDDYVFPAFLTSIQSLCFEANLCQMKPVQVLVIFIQIYISV